MNSNTPIVFVVDDDDEVRRSLDRLLRSAGIAVETFASAEQFLARAPKEPGCLVLDVKMPKVNGLELQSALASNGIHTPIVFLTGHGDIPMSVQAMKNGATDFLTKPFRAKDLLTAVNSAIEKDKKLREADAEKAIVRERLATLTPREIEIYRCVITGALNKQIAAELGISERTVKVHRARVMQKMQVDSVAELTRLSERVALTFKSSTSTES